MQEQTTTLPVISAGQNGSGTSDTRSEYYGEEGNLEWTLDERGRVNYYHYDDVTGLLDYMIEDIDDDTADSLQLDIPDGWTLPQSDDLNLRTDYQYDTFGRVTEVLGPEHTADGNTVRTVGFHAAAASP